jgi:predicted GIY-YIG superfamily endonuclease
VVHGRALALEHMVLEPCVYLLASRARSTGRPISYIGCTTDVGRRLRQHNREIAGGARSTQRGTGWTLTCAVYGFPSLGGAMSFESAAKRASARNPLALVRLVDRWRSVQPWRLRVVIVAPIEDAPVKHQ